MENKSHSIQLIFGLGKTGLSCAEFLNERNEPFYALDSRESAPFSSDVAALEYCKEIRLGRFELESELELEKVQTLLTDVAQVIVSPGVDTRDAFFDLVRINNINIIGDVELFAQHVSAPVIAITGSNGKSTVTQLTGELLQAAGYNVLIGGNIGTPALDLLKLITPDFYVLELSSFQLETLTSLKPIAGTVLNISEDHLDRYENIEAYAAVKMSLLNHCQKIIINQDENLPINLIHPPLESGSNVVSFTTNVGQIPLGLDTDKTSDYYRIVDDGKYSIANISGAIVKQSQLKIAGLHNVSNAMASLALCEASGVEISQAMVEHLVNWPGLAHRCEYIGEKDGVRCYNDSKATNVGATLAALEGLSQTVDGELILIAGGDGKGADFTPLASVFKRYLSALVLIGKDAERLLEEAGKGLKSVIVSDMKQAVASAFSYAKCGDAILLSPACASLDMYKNFEQRGDFFRKEVEALL